MQFADNYLESREIEKRRYQNCPLCGESQLIIFRGAIQDLETKEYCVTPDRGYSFCNCRNVFYTDWRNIDLGIYDKEYIKIHIDPYSSPNDYNQHYMEFEKQWEVIKRYNPLAKSFLNIGDYSDTTFDYLKSTEWNKLELTAIDIIPRESKYELIVNKFEDHDFNDRKFDIAYASHFIEHTQSPDKVMSKIKDILNPGGIVFIAMPNTRHIDFPDNPMEFPWLVKEHHILWNMYDWADFVEEKVGLQCVFKQSSYDVINREYKEGKTEALWIKEFRTIFKKLQ